MHIPEVNKVNPRSSGLDADGFYKQEVKSRLYRKKNKAWLTPSGNGMAF